MASRGLAIGLAGLAAAGAGVLAAGRDGAGGSGGGAAPASRSPAQLLAAAGGTGTPLLFRRVGRDPGVPGPVAVTGTVTPAPRPATVPLRCNRIHAGAGTGLCLVRARGRTYRALVLGAGLRVRHVLGGKGTPSRARVSPDGRYGSVTLFLAGHSYDGGDFTVQTTLLDLRRGRKLGSLEHFVVTRRGRRLTAVDMNFWGVTFARDSDRFYATLATGGRTYLVRGSVRERVARVVAENVECPSLSPDGTRIAFKQRGGPAERPWRLHVLDLATGRRTALAEVRAVDDQVEWQDEDQVLYGVDGGIWNVPADGSGVPRLLLGAAESPAVVRSRSG